MRNFLVFRMLKRLIPLCF